MSLARFYRLAKYFEVRQEPNIADASLKKAPGILGNIRVSLVGTNTLAY